MNDQLNSVVDPTNSSTAESHEGPPKNCSNLLTCSRLAPILDSLSKCQRSTSSSVISGQNDRPESLFSCANHVTKSILWLVDSCLNPISIRVAMSKILDPKTNFRVCLIRLTTPWIDASLSMPTDVIKYTNGRYQVCQRTLSSMPTDVIKYANGRYQVGRRDMSLAAQLQCCTAWFRSWDWRC